MTIVAETATRIVTKSRIMMATMTTTAAKITIATTAIMVNNYDNRHGYDGYNSYNNHDGHHNYNV